MAGVLSPLLPAMMRNTTRAHFDGLAEMRHTKCSHEHIAAAVQLAGEVSCFPFVEARLEATPNIDIAGPSFRHHRYAPLSKPLLRVLDGVVVLGTETQEFGLSMGPRATVASNTGIVVVTSIQRILAASTASPGVHGSNTGTFVLPKLLDYTAKSGLRVRFDSEADALTYSTRHHEFIRDLDWLDPAQRFAVLAVGRYFAVLDVNAFMETGTLSAYNPVLPLVQSEETGMARVRLPHSDDIRCVSANPFRVGQVASGGFDRRLVITDVTALATGEILQVRLI